MASNFYATRRTESTSDYRPRRPLGSDQAKYDQKGLIWIIWFDIIHYLHQEIQVLNVKIHAKAGAPVACFTATITKVDSIHPLLTFDSENLVLQGGG